MSPVIGLSGICYCIWFVLTHPHSKFNGYWEPSAAVLLGLGPPCVMLVSHSISDLFMGIRLLFSSVLNQHSRYQTEIIAALTHTNSVVRTEGLGAIVNIRNQVKYDLLRDGLSLILADFRPDEIRHNLMARINTKQSRMALAANLFENMSKLCPGMGMIGTLMGLIAMLSNMSDPSKLGGGMALALITTLYGLMLGTIIYGPWGERIHLEAEKCLETDMLVLEGVLNIKSKKSSLHMKDIMKTYASKTPAAKGA